MTTELISDPMYISEEKAKEFHREMHDLIQQKRYEKLGELFALFLIEHEADIALGSSQMFFDLRGPFQLAYNRAPCAEGNVRESEG